MIYLGIAFMAILAWHIVCEISNRLERGKLLNRIMARNFAEFEYYDKKFPQDIKTVREAEKALIKNETTAADEVTEITQDEKKFLAGMEEDWRPETIDSKRLAEIIDNEYSTDRENNMGREGTGRGTEGLPSKKVG